MLFHNGKLCGIFNRCGTISLEIDIRTYPYTNKELIGKLLVTYKGSCFTAEYLQIITAYFTIIHQDIAISHTIIIFIVDTY